MKKSILAVIVLIIIAVACNIFFFNLGKGNLKINNSPINEKYNPIDKYIPETEKRITDQATIDKIENLHKKLNDFMVLRSIGVKHLPEMTLTEEIIEYIFTTEYVETISFDEYKELMFCDECTKKIDGDIQMVKAENVKKIFKEIFNFLPERELGVNIIYNGYHYTESLKESGAILKYKENEEESYPVTVNKENIRYTEDDNYYYMYYYHSIDINGKTFKGIVDFEYNFLKEGKENNPQINSTNYDEYSLVKFFFKKSGSDIYFEKAEIVKE